MFAYILRRLLIVIPMLLVVSVIVFAMIQIAPYDVIDTLTNPNMSQAAIDNIRRRYGLDDPLPMQYFRWLGNVLSGDLGTSIVSQSSISKDLAVRIPNSMWLVVPAYITALVLAVGLGLWAGANRGGWIDRIIDSLSSIGLATPPFWVALLLIYLFGYQLGWFPIIGMYSVGKEGDPVDFLRHFVMPYLVLTLAYAPDLTRYVRSSTVAQLDEDYVTVQRAFGASRWEIFRKHVSRNVLIPVVTQIGLALPMLVTGAIITESIFSWPGVGPYFLSGTKSLDYPVILAILLLSATLVIVGNLIADLLYVLVDPRVRLQVAS
ncbi:MAG: ABC transporter permease [Propionibacteriaceae bacterium]|nr:ABC transporter permease [Propionibacteriaceae bacterium]